jgi:hypothetical protein
MKNCLKKLNSYKKEEETENMLIVPDESPIFFIPLVRIKSLTVQCGSECPIV